jgi:hypothetical protein
MPHEWNVVSCLGPEVALREPWVHLPQRMRASSKDLANNLSFRHAVWQILTSRAHDDGLFASLVKPSPHTAPAQHCAHTYLYRDVAPAGGDAPTRQYRRDRPSPETIEINSDGGGCFWPISRAPDGRHQGLWATTMKQALEPGTPEVLRGKQLRRVIMKSKDQPRRMVKSEVQNMDQFSMVHMMVVEDPGAAASGELAPPIGHNYAVPQLSMPIPHAVAAMQASTVVQRMIHPNPPSLYSNAVEVDASPISSLSSTTIEAPSHVQASILPPRLLGVFDNAFFRLCRGESSDRTGVKVLIKTLYRELMKNDERAEPIHNWSILRVHLSHVPQMLSDQSLDFLVELITEAKEEEELDAAYAFLLE